MKNKGFTLVELITFAAIVLIIVGICAAAVARSHELQTREKALQKTYYENEANLALAKATLAARNGQAEADTSTSPTFAESTVVYEGATADKTITVSRRKFLLRIGSCGSEDDRDEVFRRSLEAVGFQRADGFFTFGYSFVLRYDQWAIHEGMLFVTSDSKRQVIFSGDFTLMELEQ